MSTHKVDSMATHCYFFECFPIMPLQSHYIPYKQCSRGLFRSHLQHLLGAILWLLGLLHLSYGCCIYSFHAVFRASALELVDWHGHLRATCAFPSQIHSLIKSHSRPYSTFRNYCDHGIIQLLR